MARKNVRPTPAPIYTHAGGRATPPPGKIGQLRRTVLSCLLWEDTFYESGQSVAERIVTEAKRCKPEEVAALAVEARTQFHLRHAPLQLLNVLTYTGSGRRGLVEDAIYDTIQRVDEMPELLAVINHGRTGKISKMSNQTKRGLARAFSKFDEYQLAKYDRDGLFTLRDVLFLSHAKPKRGQKKLFQRVIDGTLETPDTWEVLVSAAGSDATKKKRVWTKLVKKAGEEGGLGYMALLRNIRNMDQAGVDPELIKKAIRARKGAHRVLPFRFIAAARNSPPQYEKAIDDAMVAGIAKMPALEGQTVVLVDTSHSMHAKLSAKSDMTRMDAACALASVINAEDARIFAFSSQLREVPQRRGMAGIETIQRAVPNQNTYLGSAIREVVNTYPDFRRMIIITDEQAQDTVVLPKLRPGQAGYKINVASFQNGVGYRNGWNNLDGFSENVIRYIQTMEQEGYVGEYD